MASVNSQAKVIMSIPKNDAANPLVIAAQQIAVDAVAALGQSMDPDAYARVYRIVLERMETQSLNLAERIEQAASIIEDSMGYFASAFSDERFFLDCDECGATRKSKQEALIHEEGCRVDHKSRIYERMTAFIYLHKQETNPVFEKMPSISQLVSKPTSN
ncbi:hypothetical protein ACI2KR_08475 [Pseudomonas luteola]